MDMQYTEKHDLVGGNRIGSQVVLIPDSMPFLKGVEIFGGSMPYDQVEGGDLVTFLDFNRLTDLEYRINAAEARRQLSILGENLEEAAKYISIAGNLAALKGKSGILLADVAGHGHEAAVEARELRGAFRYGAQIALDMHGEITAELFENLANLFYRKAHGKVQSKSITMIYAEISVKGVLRYINAAHPHPLIFSNEYGKFVSLDHVPKDSSTAIGVRPVENFPDAALFPSVMGYSKRYEVNELEIFMPGDPIIIATDGVLDHRNSNGEFYHQSPDPKDVSTGSLERAVRSSKHFSAKGIYSAIMEDLLKFGPLLDDASCVVIRTKQA